MVHSTLHCLFALGNYSSFRGMKKPLKSTLGSISTTIASLLPNSWQAGAHNVDIYNTSHTQWSERLDPQTGTWYHPPLTPDIALQTTLGMKVRQKPSTSLKEKDICPVCSVFYLNRGVVLAARIVRFATLNVYQKKLIWYDWYTLHISCPQ